jgi:hypothetical protein
MFALFEARWAAARAGRPCRHLDVRTAAALAAAGLLTACMPATAPLAGHDPADPTAQVAGSGYRSTIAPYASLRPASPAPQPDR